MSKFVVLDSQELAGSDFNIEKSILEAQGVECIIAECKTAEEVLEVAKDADGIGLVYVDMNRELIDQLENCKVIVRYGIGYDTIDVEAATERGIIVCNLPDYCQPDVATHTMALLLDINRKVTLLDRSCRRGNWSANEGYTTNRINGLTLGLVGFGSIARLFVKYMSGFNMDVIAYDPYLPDSFFEELNVKRVTLNELYSQADAISIHTPLTPETKHLINKETIAKMKDGVLIVNTARGPIINIHDLMEALKSGKVKAAGLDVVEIEPIFDSNADIYKLDNIIVNPHSAYNSAEASTEQHQKVAFSAIDVLVTGKMPYNAVNKKQLAQPAK
ncbi:MULTISPECIES: C-terminal binding protein [unclassified Sedimentibacter]|uniref:C-terminal binding protein n=1 Tax=unclassified Sedimentibacter TaxID=2649220 RepID=UPI0027DF0BC8|nr:C-terminal binding protein [Sedimentibacter sp. MB35-C1]WMJ78340.1 C-terminal binding protein [Sedimentibacter sp. MB35-C1]